MTSCADMNNKIFAFLESLLGIKASGNIIKFQSTNGKQVFWFVQESDGLSTWITDVGDTNVDGTAIQHPKYAKTTLGAVGTYLLDMQRLEIDEAKTEAKRAIEQAKVDDAYAQALSVAVSTHDYKVAYDTWYEATKEVNEIEIYKTVSYPRQKANNVFHVGCMLMWDKVKTKLTYKMLDCHYSDGVFCFSLFANDIPSITNSLVIGDIVPSDLNIGSRSFMLANSFFMFSETKRAGFGDAFFLESVVRVQNDIEASIPGETYKYTFECNYLFQLFRLDVDADAYNKKFSVNGVKVALRNHIGTTDGVPLYLDDGKPILSPVLIEMDYFKLISSFTYEQDHEGVGISYFPLFSGTDKTTYEYYDNYARTWKNSDVIASTGTGGNSVNTLNDISMLFPTIFYILRDPDVEDTWSSIGFTNVISFINMYNIGTGRYLQLVCHEKVGKHACYNVYRRRAQPVPYREYYNDMQQEYHRVLGYTSPYLGLSILMSLKDDLESIRNRVIT